MSCGRSHGCGNCHGSVVQKLVNGQSQRHRHTLKQVNDVCETVIITGKHAYLAAMKFMHECVYASKSANLTTLTPDRHAHACENQAPLTPIKVCQNEQAVAAVVSAIYNIDRSGSLAPLV